MSNGRQRHRLEPIAPGLWRCDTGYLRPGHTACYLLIDHGRAAIVDTGVGASVPRILQALASQGIDAAAVDWVIATHVHLDHAGGAGALMEALPRARLGVHPCGVEHMADPSRLEAGVRALYGDAFFDREYAPLTPVARQRISALEDDAAVSVGARRLQVLHTPGHAWHHLSIFDPASRVVIAGDAFGASYPGYVDETRLFLVPVVPPPQFNPAAYRASLARIVALEPEVIAPAHFPSIEAVEAAAMRLESMLGAAIDWTWQAASALDLGQRLLDGWCQWLPADTTREQLERDFGLDIWLTAEGLWLWRSKQEKKAREKESGRHES